MTGNHCEGNAIWTTRRKCCIKRVIFQARVLVPGDEGERREREREEESERERAVIESSG